MTAPWKPRHGQWVRFHADPALPTPVAARHEEGLPKVHRTAAGTLLGKYAPAQTSASTAVDIVVTGEGAKPGGVRHRPDLPDRIVLADEHGGDVTVLRGGKSVSLFFTAEPPPADQVDAYKLKGWGGVAREAAPGQLLDLPESYCRRTWPLDDVSTAAHPDHPEYLRGCPHKELKP